MLNFIIGFALGYWVAFNKETVIKYWNQFTEWLKSKNKTDNNEIA